MELVIFIGYFSLFFLLFLIVRLIRDSFSGTNNEVKSHIPRIQTVRHGHRCYMDGLNRAEYQIATLLAHNLDHNDYFIFNNIYLPSQQGVSSQIDHIVVSRFGIFVIESKQFSGWIYAHSKREKWTLTTGKNKYQFYNPIRQNFGHVSAIKEQMKFIGDRIENLVVFSGDYEFKTPIPRCVFSERDLINYIKGKNQRVFKEAELFVVIGKLSMLCQTTDISEKEHIQNVQNIIEKKSKILVKT